jgi:hypothetical protein
MGEVPVSDLSRPLSSEEATPDKVSRT